MTSNVPKNKICDGFLILRSFLKMKHSSSYFQLKLSSQIYISVNWSTFWNRILSENCAFLWNRKMAEWTPENILFFCSADRVGSETVSMNRYKIMCRMHVPIYLFPGWDVPHVSLSCRYLQIYFCKWWYSLGRNQLGKYSCYIFLILEKRMWMRPIVLSRSTYAPDVEKIFIEGHWTPFAIIWFGASFGCLRSWEHAVFVVW